MHILETQRKNIPWRWVVLMVLLGFAPHIAIVISGNFLGFTMRKFISSPAIINSISSLDILFNLLVAATCLYISDRIWTRHGRRKVFIAPAWLAMAAALFFLPLAGNAASLVTIMLCWLVFQDVAAAFEILVMEVVPPHQRGRMSALRAWLMNFFNLGWAVILVGRFDDVMSGEGFVVRGEQAIYLLGAVALVVGAIFLWFFVHERRPEGPPPAPPGAGGFKGVFTSVFAEKKLWPVYLLAFSQALIATGLGAIEPLLVTEQWGYAKQDLGTNIFVGGVINIFFIPVVGWLADRMDRVKMFAIGVVGTLLMQAAYYVFVQFILPERRPEIIHMIVFGQILSMFGQFAGIAFGPLLFDYIPRDRMGTAQAGINFVRNITRLLSLNGVGLWVVWYSQAFLPAGTFDYFSGYLFMIALQALGVGFLLRFALQVRRGKILPLGRLETETEAVAKAPSR